MDANGNGTTALEQAVLDEARRIVAPFVATVSAALSKFQVKFGLNGDASAVANGNGAPVVKRRRSSKVSSSAAGADGEAGYTPKPGDLVTYKVGRGTFTGKVASVDIEAGTAEIEREGGKTATRKSTSLSLNT